ncbi:hypothetical protein SLEP1_g26871 [Rubroshorea leprosula]|uniref:Uncharacterized protein n=1 Tax=Rubroshorea leprosula TaxID=152421 RepID=A0AAV5JVK0_9ROSI|nr:hypothetical protein SLEP1_g26871 [Rubroshorea leprosula]
MDRVVLNTDVDYQWLAPEMRAQVEVVTILLAEIDNDELERFQAVIERIKLKKTIVEQLNITCQWCGCDHFSSDCYFKRSNKCVDFSGDFYSQQYNSYPNACNVDPNTSWNNEDILEPQSRLQAQEKELCLDKNLETQSSHLLNLVAEEIQGELPSATMKNQEEKVTTLPLEIGGQLGEVEIMPTETKQEDVPKEEEEKAQVSFEVFNGESPLTKSDFNDYFVIDMIDEILQKNTYEDPFEIYFIQAKNPIKKYINCLNTSSSLESKGALLEELGRHIYWPKPKPPQNSHWRKSCGGFNLRARKPRFRKTRGHALQPDPKPPWSGRKSS